MGALLNPGCAVDVGIVPQFERPSPQHAALSPCIVGYAEIGSALAASAGDALRDNPYAAWIEMYAGNEYQEVAEAEKAFLDDLMSRRGGDGRFESLADTFRKATRLEADFWQMGLDHGAD